MKKVKDETSAVSNADKIMNSAMKLFGQYGYGSTTVRMIANDAGLSQGQITVHFGSKEELFNCIAEKIIRSMLEVYDPIEMEMEQLLNDDRLDREQAWRLIETVVDKQIDYCLNPENRNKLMMLYIVIPDSKIAEESTMALRSTVLQKIEMILAELIQAYSNKKGYLRSRTISRAVSGSIVSFGGHDMFLMREVYLSKFSPDSVEWLKNYLKEYVLNSIKAADQLPDF